MGLISRIQTAKTESPSTKAKPALAPLSEPSPAQSPVTVPKRTSTTAIAAVAPIETEGPAASTSSAYATEIGYVQPDTPISATERLPISEAGRQTAVGPVKRTTEADASVAAVTTTENTETATARIPAPKRSQVGPAVRTVAKET